MTRLSVPMGGRVRKLRAVGGHLARLQERSEKSGVIDTRSGERLGEGVTCKEGTVSSVRLHKWP